MKTLILIFGSLLASLTGARFPSLRTANAGPTAASNADDIAALRTQLEAQQSRLAQQDEEILKLRSTNAPQDLASIEALKIEIAQLRSSRPADLTDDLDDLREEVEKLRTRSEADAVELELLRKQAAVPPVPQIADATALLCKGAGVDPENVNWRIRAGLSPSQAVEVAAREKAEADERAAAEV